MGYATVVVWAGREWRRCATTWLLGLAAVSLGPICRLALPQGIVGGGGLNDDQISSIWYLSVYLGALAGLVLAARAGSLWHELSPVRQTGLAIVGFAACGLAHGLAALCALRAFDSVDWPRWLPGLLCVGHWAALATFVQRTDLKLGTKWILVSALGWWIPALVWSIPEWDRLRWWIGPDRHLEALLQPAETSVSVLVDTIPIGAWWVAAALLPSRSAFRR